MSAIVATGGCLCGELRYRIEGELVWAGYCHCASCRRFTGSVVTNWIGVRDTDLSFTTGHPASYRAGDVSRGFCRDCGSSLTYTATRFPNYVQLHLGALDDPGAIEPMAHVHCAQKVDWFEVDDALPRFAGSAAADGDHWQHS
jgi:hypothetical protein